jgi:hypothetical protein
MHLPGEQEFWSFASGTKGTSNRKYRLLPPIACRFIAGRLNFGKAAVSARRPCLAEKALLGARFACVYLFRPAYIYPVGPREELIPTIFALSIKNLGVYIKLGSSLLVMSVIGGAIVPAIMGFISDHSSIQAAFAVPLFCYGVVIYFSFLGYQPSVAIAEN